MNQARPVCYYYQKGHCRFGEDCFYLHEEDNTAIVKKPCWYLIHNGWCPYSDNCCFSHDLEQPLESTRSAADSVCIFYQQGKCSRGDGCSFLHETVAPVIGDATVENGASSVYGNGQRLKDQEIPLVAFVLPRRAAGRQRAPRSGRRFTDNRPAPKKQGTGKKTKRDLSETAETATSGGATSSVVRELEVKTEAMVLSETISPHPVNSRLVLSETTSPHPVNLRLTSSNSAPLAMVLSETTAPHPVNSRLTSNNSAPLEGLTDEMLELLNASERSQLKKRIAKENLRVLVENNVESFLVMFSSTDPDWPYDVKEIPLLVSLPTAYPKEALKVTVEPDRLPFQTLIDYLNESMKKWIETKHNAILAEGRVEIYFRPFLRWLDKNLETLFTEGLRKYKQEITLGMSSKRNDSTTSESTECTARMSVPVDDSDEISSTEAVDGSEDEVETRQRKKEKTENNAVECLMNPVRKGTEVYLKQFQLLECAGTLWFKAIKVQIRCDRCKQRFDWLFRNVGRPTCLNCARCNQELVLNYRPALLHPFTFILGFLDLIGCVADDVIFLDCKAVINCSNCNSDVIVECLEAYSMNAFRCFRCHSKVCIAFDGVRLTQIGTSDNMDLSQAEKLMVERPKKPKAQLFVQGKPLPEEGACKHYKHSHRWLRFPCCGKAYPCDVCHDEGSADGHDMVFANRMICGYCAKEQPFTPDQPCITCHKFLSKSRSRFWDGGKGCRNRTTMNRNDPKKYANTNKTQSKKSLKK